MAHDVRRQPGVGEPGDKGDHREDEKGHHGQGRRVQADVAVAVGDQAPGPDEKDRPQDEVQERGGKADVDGQRGKGQEADDAHQGQEARHQVAEHDIAERRADEEGAPVQPPGQPQHRAGGHGHRQADNEHRPQAYPGQAVKQGALQEGAGGKDHGRWLPLWSMRRARGG